MNLLSAQQKKQMTALVASRPGIRTVEISDVMDCDIAPVNEALQELVDAGTLTSHDVKAPNGRDAKAFTLSGVALPAVPGVVVAAVTAKPMTNIEKAIDFIAGNGGQATSAELHRLMGLKPTDYASSYLTGAIADGRLVKDGKTWTLGSGAPRVAPAPTPIPAPAMVVVSPAAAKPELKPTAPGPVTRIVPSVPAAVEIAQFVPPATVEALLAAPRVAAQAPIVPPSIRAPSIHVILPPAAPAPVPLPKMTYAIWSDGVMHIARDGYTVATLQPEDVADLQAYLSKFAGAAGDVRSSKGE